MANATKAVMLDETGQDIVAALQVIAGTTPSRIDAIAADIATVEASSTSTHAYAVDDFLIYNDQLYRVTSSISIGGTLTPGTNITATQVTDELGGDVESTIAGVEDGATSTSSYNVGDLFYHSGTLYRAASSIGVGDPIPGTATATTVSANIPKTTGSVTNNINVVPTAAAVYSYTNPVSITADSTTPPTDTRSLWVYPA